jgi:drug/metabolite transporter (DMT)-like permease
VVGATLIAWWWFGESPSAAAYPAAVLIAVGVVLVLRSDREPAGAVD